MKKRILAMTTIALSIAMGITPNLAYAQEIESYAVEACAANVQSDASRKEQVELFVKRLYSIFLKRTADSTGLKTWTDALLSGKSSGAEVARGFVLSDEYLRNLQSNQGNASRVLTTDLYEGILGRRPDLQGINYWVYLVENGMSYEQLLAGFSNSVEFTNICGTYGVTRGTITSQQNRDQSIGTTMFVNRLYYRVLFREPDLAGLEDWCGRLLNGNMSAQQVAESFYNSQEYLNKKTSNDDFVTTLYRTFFDREPDDAGFQNWVNTLNANKLTRAKVLAGFANSDEFKVLQNNYLSNNYAAFIPDFSDENNIFILQPDLDYFVSKCESSMPKEPEKKPVWHEEEGHYEDKWVVDKEGWTEQVPNPVYAEKVTWICADGFSGTYDEVINHVLDELSAGRDPGNYWTKTEYVVVGYDGTYPVWHDEEGHWEKVWIVDKEGYYTYE